MVGGASVNGLQLTTTTDKLRPVLPDAASPRTDTLAASRPTSGFFR